MALLSAISKEKGQEHWKIFDKSVNVAKFQEWLSEMRARNPDDKICLFMDQLSSHTSERSKKHMKDLGFRYVYNVGYEPPVQPDRAGVQQSKTFIQSVTSKETGRSHTEQPPVMCRNGSEKCEEERYH